VTNDEYWSIDIPGLAYERAVQLRNSLEDAAPWGVVLLDPRTNMVRGFDRPTVELLVTCLRAGLATGGLAHEDAAGAMSMLEDCEAWLQQAGGDDAATST